MWGMPYPCSVLLWILVKSVVSKRSTLTNEIGNEQLRSHHLDSSFVYWLVASASNKSTTLGSAQGLPFPTADGPGQVKLQNVPVGQVDLDRFFFFISYKQIKEFQNSWIRASDDFEKRRALGLSAHRHRSGLGVNLIPELESQVNSNSEIGIGIEIGGIENGIGI